MNKKRIKIVDKLINVVLDIAIFIFGVILLITLYNNIQVKILKNTYSSFFWIFYFWCANWKYGRCDKCWRLDNS